MSEIKIDERVPDSTDSLETNPAESENMSLMVQNSYKNGFEDATAQVKEQVIKILNQFSVNFFLAKQDDLAKEIRRCTEYIKQNVS